MADAHSSHSPLTRNVGKGTGTAIGAGATVDLGTFSRNPGETLIGSVFVTDNAVVQFNEGGTTVQGSSGVVIFFERTAVANQYKARAKNLDAANGRTIDWAVIGVVA